MIQFICKLIGLPIYYLLFFPKVIGRGNIRIKGSAIVISNHINWFDPLTIIATFNREIHWMGKSELFENKLAGLFFRAVSVFPVRRGEVDMVMIRHAFNLMRKGKVIGMFPEGTRSKGDRIAKFEPGTSVIALKTDTPVIPVYIKGSYKLFARIKIVVGEPVHLKDYVGKKTDATATAAANELLQNKVKELRDQII